MRLQWLSLVFALVCRQYEAGKVVKVDQIKKESWRGDGESKREKKLLKNKRIHQLNDHSV